MTEHNNNTKTKTHPIMKSNSNHFILIVLSLLLLVLTHDSAALNNVSSSCERKCGNLDIPYPFGIGKDCYLNDWYEIICKNDTFPFLSKTNLEIVNISLLRQETPYEIHETPFGKLRVKMSITSIGCSSKGEESGSSLNLTGSPFFFNEENKLIAVGCKTKAYLTNLEPSMVGCESTCSKVTSSRIIPYFDNVACFRTSTTSDFCNTSEKRGSANAMCAENRCCQVSAPIGSQQIIGVKLESTGGNSRNCNVALLTDEVYTSSNAIRSAEQVFAKGYAVVGLGWLIQTRNLSFLDSLGCGDVADSGIVKGECICSNHTVSGINYAGCRCVGGYEGSPYLGGCKDVNECLMRRADGGLLYPCDVECVNLPGSYTCKNVEEKKRVNTGAIIIGVCVGLGVLISVGGIWGLTKYVKRYRMKRRKMMFFKRNGGMLLEQQITSTEGNVDKTRIFTSEELEKATENFSENRILGVGGQGTVYKGMLTDGKTVAVKKSKAVAECNLEEFINEVVLLSQINHRHVVKLLGCCLETEVPVLVYEFIPNGNLFEHLHEESDDYTMIWGLRLRVAVDIAGSLSYLHSSACSTIFHRDVKSTNILLDEKFRAKVSDFGTSKAVTVEHTHWSTTVISGTMGYLDPEYFQTNQFTEKSDVYSFGVVLAELVTGEKPILYLQDTRANVGLAEHFRVAMKEKRFLDIMDARIKDECKLEQVMAVANLANKCLNSKGKKRPNMKEVFSELERIFSSLEDSRMLAEIDEGEEEATEVIDIADFGLFGTSGVTAPASSIVTPSFPLYVDMAPKTQ